MTRRAFAPLATVAFAGTLALFTSSCSLLGQASEQPQQPARPAVRGTPAQRLVQLDFGRDAVYTVCREPACPAVTPKTLAAVPVPAPSASAQFHLPQQAGRAIIDEAEDDAPLPLPPRRERVLVHFTSGGSTLTPQGRAVLDDALPFARRAERIVISGRTDVAGATKVNETLAFARAMAVRDHIRERLPDLGNVIVIDARGKCCYVATNGTPEGRAMNRRVEVVFNVRG